MDLKYLRMLLRDSVKIKTYKLLNVCEEETFIVLIKIFISLTLSFDARIDSVIFISVNVF